MIDHVVEVQPAGVRLERDDQLAWWLAQVATDPVEVARRGVAEAVRNSQAFLRRGLVRSRRLDWGSGRGTAFFGAA